MKKPAWWNLYRGCIVILTAPAVFLMFINLPIGIIAVIVLALLFAQQSRREKSWVEEKRHQETIEALRQSNQPPK